MIAFHDKIKTTSSVPAGTDFPPLLWSDSGSRKARSPNPILHFACCNGASLVRIQAKESQTVDFSKIPNLFSNEAILRMTLSTTKSPFVTLAHITILAALFLFSGTVCIMAQSNSKDAPDVLVLSNGDTLHGKLVDEVGGTITFHTDAFGDVAVSWDKIKELHAAGNFTVLDKNVKRGSKRHKAEVPAGAIDVADGNVTVHSTNPPPPIPVKNAEYIVDAQTLDKQLNHEPNLLSGWNGAATAGATLVQATQNQYTVSGALGLVRAVPTVTWLNPRNRTSFGLSGSYGKITQPAYTSNGVVVAPVVTKSAIFHLEGERDQYVSQHFFALAQTAFDHNFAQNLQLQQIYGGGMGWTIFSTPRHSADLKATLQYEKQQFISSPDSGNQNLIGSTFSANYLLKTRLFSYAQSLGFIPAYNAPRDYSATETDTIAFPAYKNLAFSLGTIDSYLNDSPVSVPPTKRNSFQFTMGLTYAIKSKY